MLYLLALVLLSWFSEFQAAVQLPQTEKGGWITIEEETEPSIKCNGLDEGSNVTWSLIHPDNNITNIGSCAPSQISCPSSDSNFQLSRNTKQESFMKINSNHRALIGTSVKCAQGTSNAATAKFLIIRRGTIRECETREDYTTTWTLSINCPIQDAFSSNNRYSCTWSLPEMGTQVTAETDFHHDSADAGDQLISANCNITWSLPASDGFYTYDFKFFPGPVTPQTLTNVSIRSPQAPHTAPNCPDYVAVNDSVTCDCVTTDPGSPPSEIRWLEFTSHQLIVHNVTPDMNGTVYTCLQTWKSRAFANVSYTLQVTDKYTTISGPSPFIADGTKKMILTCSTVNVNLEHTYNWTGVVCDNGNQGNMCSFTPRVPDDDGKIVTCTPSSNITSAGLASANFNMTLYYPPSQPVITGYNTSQVLTVGDSVSLTCTVSGGKPSISNITFYCKGQEPDAVGLFDPSSSSSTVTISSLKALVGNTTPCLCESNKQWPPDPTRSFENLVKLTTLNVPDVDQSSSIVGAAVGGGVAAAVAVAAVVGIFIYRKCFGNDRYARPQPRQEEPNYTDLVLYENVGNTQQQTVNEITDPDSASPYVNQGADVDNDATERSMDYYNTKSAESVGGTLYDRLEAAPQESSNYTGLILNKDGNEHAEHEYQNTSYP